MQTLGSPGSLASWLESTVRLAWFGSWIVLVVVVAWSLAGFVTSDVDALGLLPPVDVYSRLHPPSKLEVDLCVRSGAFEEATLDVTQGMISYRPSNWVGVALLLGPAVINLALWLLILHRLLGFIRTLRQGRPFIEENGRRLRTIGLAVVGIWVVSVSTGLAVNLYARAHFELAQGFIRLLPEFQLLRLFVGLMLLVIAEVFRIGARLQKEQDSTI